MPLLSSGQIKMSQINSELGRTSTSANSALKNLSTGATVSLNGSSTSKPNGTAPHSMSEWHGYNHSASSVSYSSRVMAYDEDLSSNACNGETTTTIYYDDSTTWNGAETIWYTSNTGATEVNTGYYSGVFESYGYFYNDGEKEAFLCGRSERRLKYNIEFIGESPMGIPMYHFNYKNEEHGKGRFVGTMVDDLQRLGFEDNVFEQNGELWVIYDKRIDVPFESVTN